MSLISPTQVPVRVYRSTNAGAPVLSQTVGSIAGIIKECLVTGYGAEAGAGWTLMHEDVSTKSYIYGFNNTESNNGLLGLRVWGEDTWRINVALVSDIVDANTATVVAKCSSEFMHHRNKSSGNWALIASDRGFWFFNEIIGYHPTDKSGTYLFAGTTPSVVKDYFVIRHTGGTYTGSASDPNRRGVTYYGVDQSRSCQAVVCDLQTKSVSSSTTMGILDGSSNKTQPACIMPIFAVTNSAVCQMPIYASSRNDQVNFSTISDGRDLMCFCTDTEYQKPDSNAYVPLDYWEH